MLPSGRCKDILIIADDSFFCLGLEHYIQQKRKTNSRTICMSAERFIKTRKFVETLRNCLVIVSVKDFELLEKVTQKVNDNFWEMIFFFDVLECNSASYKWGFTSKRNQISSLVELLKYIDSAHKKKLSRNQHDFKGEDIVRRLCKGTKTSVIAEEIGMSEKGVYREKGRVIKKLGLDHLNSINLLLCESLLNVAKVKVKNMESV